MLSIYGAINRTALMIIMLVLTPVDQTLSQTDEPAGSPAMYAQIGTQACLVCHNNPAINSILNTPHGRQLEERTQTPGHGCAGCHGPSQEHISGVGIDGKRPSPEIIFGTRSGTYPVTGVEKQNQVCLVCHNNRIQQDRNRGQHNFADLACTSCHRIHSTNNRVMQTP